MKTRLCSALNTSMGAGLILLTSCNGASTASPASTATGGMAISPQGGSSTNGNGGARVTGGMPAAGGAIVASSNGGATRNQGGSPANGGVTSNGGAFANGGSSPTGGTANRGGTNANGGVNSLGGANGGVNNMGGANANGGSIGTCADTPRSSESCADAKAWGFCSQTWFGGYCQATCGACSSASGGSSSSSGGASPNRGGASATGGAISNGGAPTGGRATGGVNATGSAATGGIATGGSTGGTSVPRLTNGSSGITTRYWDCCMPSCSWRENAIADGKSSPSTVCARDGSTVVAQSVGSACDGGSGFECNWGAPWQAGPNLAYGYAAHNGGNCGKCYQLDFTGAGDNAGAQLLSTKTMIVQVVNTGGIAANQFDLLIPGGGVGANNACTGSNGQWGNVPGGATYGGFLTTCGPDTSCVTSMCQAAFGSNAALMAGCSWFVGWFAAASNPDVMYAEVPCPAELTNKSGLR